MFDRAKEWIHERTGSSNLDHLVGLAALSGAYVLYPTVGEWSADFYVFARYLTFILSLIVVYWAYKAGKPGWVAFAAIGMLIFNPIFPVLGNISWDMIGVIYAIGYGLLGISTVKFSYSKFISLLFAFSGVILIVITAYVNYNLPHGELYDTGDIVCMNDDRGPCGPEMVEDLSNLNIPNWAKFLKGNLVWTMLFFICGSILSATRDQDVD